MKRRSKQNSDYWQRRLLKLLEQEPDAKYVKYRYRTLKALLWEKYKPIIESVSTDTMQEFLKDVCYLDRELRLHTEKEEKKLKTILSQEKVLELGYTQKDYNRVIYD